MIQAVPIQKAEMVGTPAALLGAIPDFMSFGSVLPDTFGGDMNKHLLSPDKGLTTDQCKDVTKI